MGRARRFCGGGRACRRALVVPRSLCHIRAPRNICAASSCLRCNSCALCHARYNRNWANRMTATTAAPSSLSLRRLMTQVHRNSSDSCGARPEPRCHIGTSVHAALLPRVASGVGFRPWCWRVRPLMPWHALEHAQGIDLVTDCFFLSPMTSATRFRAGAARKGRRAAWAPALTASGHLQESFLWRRRFECGPIILIAQSREELV